MSFASRPVVIFDFDGTIADSLQLVIDAYNRIAPYYRVKRVDMAEVPRLRREKAQAVLREHNITFWKLPIMASHLRFSMRARADTVHPFAGIVDALRAVRAAGVRCSMLSTNSNANIDRFLRRHDAQLFHPIAGGTSTFGKARALRALIAREGWQPAQVVYVGDEVRDIEAAHRAGIRACAVTWGYSDPGALKAQGPWRVAERPEQLVELLTGSAT